MRVVIRCLPVRHRTADPVAGDLRNIDSLPFSLRHSRRPIERQKVTGWATSRRYTICGFRKETIAGTHGNGRDAPIPAVHVATVEPLESGLSGPSPTSAHCSAPGVIRWFDGNEAIANPTTRAAHGSLRRDCLERRGCEIIVCSHRHRPVGS